MDTYRAFLAIIISFVILVGYQYFFVGFEQPVETDGTVEQTAANNAQTAGQASTPVQPQAIVAAPVPVAPAPVYDRAPKEIKVETELYTAIFSEDGGTVTSFRLKNHTETSDADSLGMELVKTSADQGFPLQFSWGSAVGPRVLFDSSTQNIHLSEANKNAVLTMTAQAGNGLVLERTYAFRNDTFLIDMSIKVKNSSQTILQGIPQIGLVNTPFEGVSSPANRFLFSGPALFMNGELTEVKVDEFEAGPKKVQGAIDWVAYEGNYFICAVVPLDMDGASFSMEGNEALTKMQLAGELDTLQPGTEKEYSYHVVYGPKKLSMLEEVGYNLDKSVNFGWFDIIAKPTLWLLNTFYDFTRNYGIAITQKGLKSMKNMQKLQPKMVKIKEKYKDDPTKMNQEVMSLYKTYKVNPLGGCLPMVLQIPVFFALYKVLLQSIELRHAPFMLWITDLAAPDRLWIGFELPYLGGLPVLTLLMGASMFLQQKLSPTTADPTQAKIMMFLPVVFTFMFLNFASGLVLYWFINNLLSILQQVLINRDSKKTAAA